ncbi:phytol kinase 1, chloroplastic-like isoform X1 [Chenopodium quinoa]|uniref:phytol kinase 1, chloroplastic-like isoform X1 n=1 Tax=Chenopodium quinoa TaxID=63459 RepID=UPI000B773FF7|nr:phytol kinase 1, chloroplastic-like isoform X1 [Chenopodium quinoa]
MAIHLKLNTHHHCSRSFGTAQPCPSYSNLTFFHFHRHHYPFSETTLKHNSAASTVVSRRALLSSDAALFQDVGATAFLVTGGYSLVSVFDNLTHRNIISQNLSRKLVHIISGLLFVAAWPLFSASPEARYFASLAPFINGLRLVVNGLSLATDEGLLKSVTREGKPEELLRGPLYYVLILALSAIFFWRDSPVGLLLLAMMSGGDGIADIMGRKFGYVKLPYNQKKSWAGSISMFTFGFLISMGMLYYFSVLGYFQFDWNLTAQRVAVVSFVATVVESLPTAEQIDDNISVPLATMVTAYLCM